MPNNKYGNKWGTSMAAPHVAGVAAMVWSANNSLTGAEVKELVTRQRNPCCTPLTYKKPHKIANKLIHTPKNPRIIGKK